MCSTPTGMRNEMIISSFIYVSLGSEPGNCEIYGVPALRFGEHQRMQVSIQEGDI